MSKNAKRTAARASARKFRKLKAEILALTGSEANEISRRDNNWLFEVAYSMGYVAERIAIQYAMSPLADYRGGGPTSPRQRSDD